MDEKLTETQKLLLAKVEADLSPTLALRAKNLVRAGAVSKAEIVHWLAMVQKHHTSSAAILRWRQQGISLVAIEQTLELRTHIIKEIAWAEGLPDKGISVVALFGLLRKLNVSEEITDIQKIPPTAYDRMTSLISAATLAFPTFPLQGLMRAINEKFNGSVERAYQLCYESEEDFVGVLRGRMDVMTALCDHSPAEPVETDSSDEGLVFERALRDLGIRI